LHIENPQFESSSRELILETERGLGGVKEEEIELYRHETGEIRKKENRKSRNITYL